MENNCKLLKEKAKQLRELALEMIYHAGSGHPGGSLSAADIMAALYYREMNLDPQNPGWEDRDRFVLSKGHVCPILYACLAMKGFFPKDAIYTLRKQGSILQGHPDMKRTPGVDMSAGSLGQGISCAVGMALTLKQEKRDSRVFCLLGDGECDEGQVWEALETANKYALNNLIIIVDNNGLQNDGTTDQIMPTRSLAEKFAGFGMEVYSVDGHDMQAIMDTFDLIRASESDRPKAVIAKTVKGKGVSYMENVVMWHGLAPSADEYRQAIMELEAAD